MKYFPFEIQNEEGSALPTVLIVIVIITLFIGAVLSGIYVQNWFFQQDIDAVKARYITEAGIYQFLDKTPYTEIQNKTIEVLYMQDSSRVEISAHSLGGFLDITSTTSFKNQRKSIRVLVGEQQPEWFENAIILGDSTSELTVTGSTNITGDIVTGQRGVRPTNFKGYPFSGSLNGDVERKRGKLLPVFYTAYLASQMENFEDDLLSVTSNNHQSIQNEFIAGASLSSGDTVQVNGNATWTTIDSIKVPDDVTFIIAGNLTLNGNYQFGRYNKIIVRDTLRAGGSISGSHILLYAGESFQVGGGANISCQCLSGNEIIIRDDAYLRYPSFVYSGEEFASSQSNEIIQIQNNSVVDGNVVYPFQQTGFTSENFRVSIGENATVRGGVYNMSQTEPNGKIFGSLLTQQLYFYESPTEYINWLKDSDIDVTARPLDFVVPLGFSDNPIYKVLEWQEIES